MPKSNFTIPFLKHLKKSGVGVEHDVTIYALNKIPNEHDLNNFLFDLKNNGYIRFSRYWGDFGWDSPHNTLIVKATITSGGEKRLEEYRVNRFTKIGVLCAIGCLLVALLGYNLKDILSAYKPTNINKVIPKAKKITLKKYPNPTGKKDTSHKILFSQKP